MDVSFAIRQRLEDLGLDQRGLARAARGDDPFGLRGEFVQLVELAQSLHTSAPSHARNE